MEDLKPTFPRPEVYLETLARAAQLGAQEFAPDVSLLAEDRGLSYDPNRYIWGGGVYSNMEIKEALDSGHIRIFPFVESYLQTTSHDVTLGEYYYSTDEVGDRNYYDFRDPKDVQRYFKHYHQATTYDEWLRREESYPFKDVQPEDRIIVVPGHRRILAHTNEFIGIRAPGTTQMQAKSVSGRNGFVVCKDAGWGDPGYLGRWTMEIQNDNNEAVALIVGEPIAQMIFYRTGPILGSYSDRGTYYQVSSLREDVRSWRPEMMLPRYRSDKRRPHIPVLSIVA